MSDKLNGAAAFFKILTANGIDTLSACPGTSEMQVVDEAGYSDLKVVTCIFENTVTGACDGYARMLDRPALGLVHVACGLTNSIACLHNARKAASRMILFGGGIHAAHEVNDPEHAMLMRQPDLAAAVSAFSKGGRSSSGEPSTIAANVICNQQPLVSFPMHRAAGVPVLDT